MSNTKIITYSKQPTRDNLKRVYDVVNKLFQNHEDLFYTSEQVKKLKQDKSNNFI